MTTTDIFNNALLLIGTQIQTTIDTNTKEGRIFNAVYEMTRNSLLRAHLWNFALARTSIAALAEAPAWGYQYQFELPSDCLQLIQVNDYQYNVAANYYTVSDESTFKIEGGIILTDLPAPLDIRYIRLITNPGQFDSCFVEMLSIRIAMKMVEAVKSNSGLMQTLMQLYKDAKFQALNSNAVERPTTNMIDGEFVTSRM